MAAESGAIAQPFGQGGSSEGVGRFISQSLSNHAILSMSDQQSTGKQTKIGLAMAHLCHLPTRLVPACPSGWALRYKTVSIRQQSDETCPVTVLKRPENLHVNIG